MNKDFKARVSSVAEAMIEALHQSIADLEMQQTSEQ